MHPLIKNALAVIIFAYGYSTWALNADIKFLNLPSDIQQIFFLTLPIVDVIHLSQTCKSLHARLDDPCWELPCKQSLHCRPFKPDHIGWRSLYQQILFGSYFLTMSSWSKEQLLAVADNQVFFDIERNLIQRINSHLIEEAKTASKATSKNW